MVKCAICNEKIETTFLNKIIGTIIKDEKGKKQNICSPCQKKFSTKEEIFDQLKK